jgi:hypothetical protein
VLYIHHLVPLHTHIHPYALRKFLLSPMVSPVRLQILEEMPLYWNQYLFDLWNFPALPSSGLVLYRAFE